MVFYFRRSVKVTKEFYLYTGLSLAAEIGGYVGLLMGFSVFSVANIFTNLVRFLCKAKKLYNSLNFRINCIYGYCVANSFIY